MDKRGRVLVVDDDEDIRLFLEARLAEAGYRQRTVADASAAWDALDQEPADVILCDQRLGATTGVEFCRLLQESWPEIPLILITAYSTLDVAIDALRAGAYDFIPKPLEMEIVVAALDRALQKTSLAREVEELRSMLEDPPTFLGMVGESRALRSTGAVLRKAARTPLSVLVTGETGTGKEVAARALHELSPRAEGPFLAINCASIPGELLESELFGHVRGAFTDAKEKRTGLLVQADGGTLFLDEVGDMPLELQSKLLRALQERKVRPVGGASDVPFDVRLVTATNQDLEGRIREGSFRQDLLYRINVFEVELPPLRERGNDVLLLAQFFLERAAAEMEVPAPGLSPELAARLLAYPWPGNVRELENVMQRAVAMAEGSQLLVEDLPEKLRAARPDKGSGSSGLGNLVSLADLEREHIGRVLEELGGNKLKAAKVLGIDRTTLYRKLERYGIR